MCMYLYVRRGRLDVQLRVPCRRDVIFSCCNCSLAGELRAAEFSCSEGRAGGEEVVVYEVYLSRARAPLLFHGRERKAKRTRKVRRCTRARVCVCCVCVCAGSREKWRKRLSLSLSLSFFLSFFHWACLLHFSRSNLHARVHHICLLVSFQRILPFKREMLLLDLPCFSHLLSSTAKRKNRLFLYYAKQLKDCFVR